MKKPKISLTVKDQKGKVTKLADDINNLSPEGRAIAKGIVDTLVASDNVPDVFHWANETVSVIEELDVEMFIVSKNFVPYIMPFHTDLERQLRPLFIDDMLEAVFAGAETGMKIREMHSPDNTENALDFVQLDQVNRADTLIHLITKELNDVQQFSHDEHDIARMKMLIVRFTPRSNQQPFYICKQLQASHIIAGSRSWSLESNGFRPNPMQATVKVTPDNQVLILGDLIFAFNVSKFNKMFAYDARRSAALDGKIAEIEKHFKLSFPDGLSLKAMVEDNAKLAEKILRADPANVDQEKMIETADEFQLALMQDDAGAFIIMDSRDAMMFANLLNDDYVESNTSGIHYLAGKKQEVSAAVDAQMNMGV
jgi:hypothetical protein